MVLVVDALLSLLCFEIEAAFLSLNVSETYCTWVVRMGAFWITLSRLRGNFFDILDKKEDPGSAYLRLDIAAMKTQTSKEPCVDEDCGLWLVNGAVGIIC